MLLCILGKNIFKFNKKRLEKKRTYLSRERSWNAHNTVCIVYSVIAHTFIINLLKARRLFWGKMCQKFSHPNPFFKSLKATHSLMSVWFRWCSTPARGLRSWGCTASWKTPRCPSPRSESTPCPASRSTTRDPKRRCLVSASSNRTCLPPSSSLLICPHSLHVLCASRSLPRHRQLLWRGGGELLIRTGRQRRPHSWTGGFG